MNPDEPDPPPPPAAEAINAQASTWMKRGLDRLTENTTASLTEAIHDFDRAVVLRSGLPVETNPRFSYALAASWMNRADALTRLGGPEHRAEAVRAYDEALALLRALPLAADPLFRRRLAIAWQNRGLTLQMQGPGPVLAEAVRSFDQAIAVLRDQDAAEISDRDLILAAAWMNRGNTLLSLDPAESAAARIAARESLALATRWEERAELAAEIGFKARQILCRAIAHLLEEERSSAAAPDEWVAEATDAVDGGMGLANFWEQQGVDRFRAPAAELFRFGARIYQAYQPHFLVEFLLENLDPERSSGAAAGNRVMHTTAVAALWRAFHELQRGGFQKMNSPQFEQVLESLRELRIAEERLAELRRRYLAAG